MQDRKDVMTLFNDYTPELKKIAPDNFRLEALSRIIQTEFKQNSALNSCTPASITKSFLQCAELGLEPSSTRGLAYLVPYKGECKLVVGYKGFMHLARESGQIKSIQARIVRSSDDFFVSYGTDEKIHHIPKKSNNSQVTHVYAVAKLANGECQFDVMNIDEINKARSTAATQKVWGPYFEEMAKKTAIRRLCKYLPMTKELQTAVGIDEVNEIKPIENVSFNGSGADALLEAIEPTIKQGKNNDESN